MSGVAAEEILWFGDEPEAGAVHRLDRVGDLWHSGLQRGTANRLSELRYWQPVYWWYLNDGPSERRSVSWRVDPTGFAVRREAWDRIGGMDGVYHTETLRALDLGFRLLRAGGVPLHVPGLFAKRSPGQSAREPATPGQAAAEPARLDRYLFFCRHFKRDYRLNMWLRESMRRRRPVHEWRLLRRAEQLARKVAAPETRTIPPRPLVALPDPPPTVSAIIPTMRRQALTRQLLEDLADQSLPLHEVVVVDATPPEERTAAPYESLPDLPVEVLWQQSLGSCRARNEAIAECTGHFILFADDDIRVLPDYVENHVRLLESYGAEAANGLDLQADDPDQGLTDLEHKLQRLCSRFERVGADHKFSNANSCVRREWVERLNGNDVNFDGGYGEDTDFGQRIVEQGGVLLYNPFSANLHLKPAFGGYRWWGRWRHGSRKPWELHRRVGWIKPKPSPTIMYGFLKHYGAESFREWKWLYLLRTWWPTRQRPDESLAVRLVKLPWRLAMTPLALLRIRLSRRFADDLRVLGPRYS